MFHHITLTNIPSNLVAIFELLVGQLYQFYSTFQEVHVSQ